MQNQPSLNLQRPFPLLMVPPPITFAVAFAVGVVVQHVMPLALSPVPRGARLAGAALLVAGIVAGLSLAAAFVFRRTTLNPFAEPATFIANGPYRFSRNPMYLSLIVAYCGGVLLYGSLWPLLALIGPVAVLERAVIPREEAQLAATFGESYERYRAQVRRWL